MQLSTGEKIKIIMKRRGMTAVALATKLGTSRQNLQGKMGRSNFSEKELQDIADALGCSFASVFTMNDTGETI